MYILIVHHGQQHRMQVDQRNMVLDLSRVDGALLDPTITKVEWSQVLDGKTIRDGGIISRGADRAQLFYDRSALSPYMVEFEAEWLRRQQDQQEHDARQAKSLDWVTSPPLSPAQPIEVPAEEADAFGGL